MLGWLLGKAFGVFGHLDVVAMILGQSIDSGFGAMLTFALFAAQAVLLPWMFFVLLNGQVRATCRQPRPKPWPWLEWGTLALVLLIMTGAVRLPWSNRCQTGVYFTNLKPVATATINEQSAELTQGGSLATSVPVASVETWSPTLAPGEKPD